LPRHSCLTERKTVKCESDRYIIDFASVDRVCPQQTPIGPAVPDITHLIGSTSAAGGARRADLAGHQPVGTRRRASDLVIPRVACDRDQPRAEQTIRARRSPVTTRPRSRRDQLVRFRTAEGSGGATR
jgi:hypothetical protein